jgi:hypothetical protein
LGATPNALAQGFHEVDDVGGALGRLLVFDRFACGLALYELLELGLVFVLECRWIEMPALVSRICEASFSISFGIFGLGTDRPTFFSSRTS